MAALAAEAALDAPRASMMAAPRCWTVGNELLLHPGVVADDLGRRPASDPGPVDVGILGGGVVAPDGHVGDLGDGHPGLGRQLGLGPVLIEAHHGGEALGRDVGGVVHGDEGVGVGRVADDEHPDVGAALSESALPWAVKMAPLASSRSLRSMPLLRGRAPTSRAMLTSPNASWASSLMYDLTQQREGAVVELHDDAPQGPQGRGDLEELQDDRLIGSEQGAAGDPEQQVVADLAGGAGDGDTNRGSGHRG